jgi:adenylate cyclase
MSLTGVCADSVQLLKSKGQSFLWKYRILLLSGIAAAGCVFLLRSLGILQLLELAAFDRLLQARPHEVQDNRIVLVGFSEKDFRKLGSSQISDEVMADLLTKIQAQKPRVVGLDMFRNLASPPGQEKLTSVFQNSPNLIGIAKVIGNGIGEDVMGHPALVDQDRISASDVLVDVDGRVRRGLFFPSAQNPIEGLGLRLALDYLQAMGITPELSSETLRLKNVEFPPVAANDGGYINTDAGGYQVLMNPRGSRGTFQMVAAQDVLTGKISGAVFRDRIVIIGDISAGGADAFFTSYSSKDGSSPAPMSGIELHANVTSQIISAVLDERPLIRALPKSVEWTLILGFIYVSGWLASRRLPHVYKSTLGLVLLGTVVVWGYAMLVIGWWIPIVPMSLGIAFAGAMMMTWEAQTLTVLSNQDGLTQLANRRLFDEMVQREWFRAVRSQTPLSLILCDVDYFKIYNDTYGHAKGDECLRRVAAGLKKAVKRPMDLAARYGGEEFVVLLPHTDAQGALRVAKVIQAEIQGLQLEHRGSRVSPFVTLSLGVTSLVPSVGMTVEILLETADAGLYEAKQKGRNQAVLKLH